MDINTVVTTVIGNYGFPILCCGAMAFYIYKHEQQHQQNKEKLNEKIFKYVEVGLDAFIQRTNSFNSLSSSLERLVDKMEKKGDDESDTDHRE